MKYLLSINVTIFIFILSKTSHGVKSAVVKTEAFKAVGEINKLSRADNARNVQELIESSAVDRIARLSNAEVNGRRYAGENYYKLSDRKYFNISEDILGKSLHISSDDGAIETNELGVLGEGDIVIVPSSYDDIIEEDDEYNVEGEESENDTDFHNGFEDINNKDFQSQAWQSGDDMDREFRQLIQGGNTSDQIKYSNFYFNKFVASQGHLLEEMNLNSRHYGNKIIEPLFLTPLVYSQNYKLGQQLSAVKPLVGDIKSHAGYFTVDKRFNSNMFFWFFPCEQDYRKKPVLLWLQGGPGASSLFGLFYENGPYKIVDDKILRNEHTWSKHYNVLYIDNPVGTGFSFTNKDGFAKNQTIIGRHLYEALKQFFYLFPELNDNDFYITGESYAGKYIPSIGFEIHKRNLLSHFKINLKGLFIGNGLVDPISMLNYNEYFYHIGLLDEYQQKLFAAVEKRVEFQIRMRQWQKAANTFANLFFTPRKDQTGPNFHKMTGFTQHYNLNGLDFSTRNFDKILQDRTIRERIHVGNMKYNNGDEVYEHIRQDLMKSVLPKVNILVENYRVVFYYGQLDMICPYRLSVPFFANIEFKDAHDYYKAERQVWTYERDDDQDNIVGFIKEAGNLVEVLFRNAGHMVPRDQPRFMMDLLKKYIAE